MGQFTKGYILGITWIYSFGTRNAKLVTIVCLFYWNPIKKWLSWSCLSYIFLFKPHHVSKRLVA